MEDETKYMPKDVATGSAGQGEVDYRSEYEREHLRNADLAGRVADLEAKCDELTFKLSRIKENPLWKMSAPLRRCMHFIIRQKNRLKNCGNLRGVLGKIIKEWCCLP